jgi:hypothetical protein
VTAVHFLGCPGCFVVWAGLFDSPILTPFFWS